MADRILADLNEHLIARLESLLDLARVATETGSLPVDLTGVENTVAATSDVDERSFHAGEHVLDTSEVHVADHRRGRRVGDEVLDQHSVFEDCYLCSRMRLTAVCPIAHNHDAIDGLTTREELRLGQDRWATSAGVTTVAATLTLRFQTCRTTDALDLVLDAGLVARFALVNDGVRRIVLGRRSRVGGTVGAGLATTTTAATAARSVGIEIGIVGILGIRISGGLGLITGFFAGSVVGLLLDCRRGRFLLRFGSGIRLFVRTLLATLFTATTSTSTASTTTATRLIVVLVLGLGALALGLRCGHSRLFDGRNCNRRCLENDGFGFRGCLLLFDDRRCSRLAACATATRSYLGGFEIRLQEQRDLRRGGSHLGLMGLRRLEGSEQIGLLGFLALQRSSGVESSADLGDSRIHCFFCCRFFDDDLFAGATSLTGFSAGASATGASTGASAAGSSTTGASTTGSMRVSSSATTGSMASAAEVNEA